jgi:hypothetical protein
VPSQLRQEFVDPQARMGKIARSRREFPGRQAKLLIGQCALGGTRLADGMITMSQIITRRLALGVLEHAVAIVLGFILMILGLGLSVTMIMLPVGLVLGLAGLALFISGMCVRFDWI